MQTKFCVYFSDNRWDQKLGIMTNSYDIYRYRSSILMYFIGQSTRRVLFSIVYFKFKNFRWQFKIQDIVYFWKGRWTWDIPFSDYFHFPLSLSIFAIKVKKGVLIISWKKSEKEANKNSFFIGEKKQRNLNL